MKKKKILTLLLTVFSLSSCEITLPVNTSISSNNPSTTETDSVSEEEISSVVESESESTFSSEEVSSEESTSEEISSEETFQIDFDDSDKSLMFDIVGETVPYLQNSTYYVEEDKDYSDTIDITYQTTQDLFNQYLETLSQSYTFDGKEKDGEGDYWYYYYNQNIYIEIVGYTYKNNYWVEMYVYPNEDSPDDPISEEPISIPDDGTGYCEVDFSTAKVKNITEIGDYLDGMPTTGSPSVLVIPVEFPDVTAESKNYTIDTIEKAFKGTKDDGLIYDSVYDYFYQSSNEQLSLNIDIVDEWYTTEHRWNYYKSLYSSSDIWGNQGEDSAATGEQLILNEALSYLDSQGYDLSKYDSDNNGIIDSVVMIYTHDADYEGKDDLAWAWRFWNYLGNPENDYDYYYYDDVSANDYLWASYQFFDEEVTGYTGINTYTLIHEFSHVLGADDYYDTAYISDPLDGYDIMDRMYADHCPFTKMLLGWIGKSKIITAENSVTIDLEDFETTGDTIIIANNWNNNGVFQEYWIIEYYTNNGLNTSPAGLFDEEGILVYHVNASIKEMEEYSTTDRPYYSIINNNTDSSDENGTINNLIEFVKNGDKYIYGIGDSISSSTKDDSGNIIPYVFNIKNIENGKATITFSKNEG